MRRAIVVCFLLIFFVGCSRQPQRNAASGLIPVTVAHWGHEKILIYLPLYVAIDAGFFKQQGLDIRIKYSGNDDQVFATVISGAAQFGVGDPTFTAISRERGGPGKVVATLVGRVANWGVTNEKNLKAIQNPHALDGLRVTSFPSPSTTYTILSEIKSTLHLRRMKIVQLTPGSELGALERHDADIAMMLEPQTSLAVSKGYHVVWSLAKYYGPFTLTGLTTSDEEIAKHPEVVQKMVNGLQEALDFIHSHPMQTVQIAKQNFPSLPDTVVQDAVNRMLRDKTIPDDVRILPEAWQKAMEIRKKVGDLKSIRGGFSAIDNTFADDAIRDVQHKEVNAHDPPGSARPSGISHFPKRSAVRKPLPVGGCAPNGEFWTWTSRSADLLTVIGVFVGLVWAISEFYSRYRPFPEEDFRFRAAASWLAQKAKNGFRKLSLQQVRAEIRTHVNQWDLEDIDKFLDSLHQRRIVSVSKKDDAVRLPRSLRSLKSGETHIEILARYLKKRYE